MQFEYLFSEAFDTFKVFENLTVSIVAAKTPETPKTLWQILNHLIIWQKNQISLLTGNKPETSITETETWIEAEQPADQNEIDNAVAIFNTQLLTIKAIPPTLSSHQHDISFKLKTLQDMSNHLSFHLGEIVLMRRLCKTYPMPEEMKLFLALQ
ncbi:hypothetical protein ACFQZS_14445 [Mucilaginibacter calamicampi]|uniref:DinB family protein n=1 Tax=Mucilaginibacter calamicampi TaxID=1302352 RepID=A0ABW2YXY8_9SPHI